jgi:hypothetical protein
MKPQVFGAAMTNSITALTIMILGLNSNQHDGTQHIDTLCNDSA